MVAVTCRIDRKWLDEAGSGEDRGGLWWSTACEQSNEFGAAKASVDGLWDGRTSQDGGGLQRCVAEVGPRMVVFQPLEALRVSTVWLISYEVHVSDDDDAHSPSSFITRSSWLLPSLSCFKWDLLFPHCIASLDVSSLLILWPCCLWLDLHILWCLNLNLWRTEYGWEWILFVCDDVSLLK